VIAEVGLPACRRRPSISTTVRAEPRPRRLTVAVPLEPLDSWSPGGEGLRQGVDQVFDPRHALRLDVGAPIEVTGATLVRFGVGIRVPVTTISGDFAAGGRFGRGSLGGG
jgi:hypothetical protein